MKRYKLTKQDIYKGNLILINKDNLRKSFVNKKDLVPFNNIYNDILLDKEANEKLQLLLKKINANKEIVPVSGYRTTLDQIKIYNGSLKDNGYDFTNKYVAKPHASEHETGLAIDLGINSKKIDFLRPKFPHTGMAAQFRLFAAQYGFIERYKKTKENITNIAAEEWHFRYVGYPHSKIMAEMNLCLEEYISYLKNHKIKYQNYLIYYLPFNNDMIITLGDKDLISGNNIDGFIITKLME